MSDKIEKIALKDCSENTLIKYVPNIINDNNKEIKRVFEDIFEFGNDENQIQYIKVPINTKGTVKGNSGKFYNIYAMRATFDSSSLSQDFLNAKVLHNNAPDRFKESLDNDIMDNFSHDAENIFYKYNEDELSNIKISVKDELNIIDTNIKNFDASIKDLYKKIEDILKNKNI